MKKWIAGILQIDSESRVADQYLLQEKRMPCRRAKGRARTAAARHMDEDRNV